MNKDIIIISSSTSFTKKFDKLLKKRSYVILLLNVQEIKL